MDRITGDAHSIKIDTYSSLDYTLKEFSFLKFLISDVDNSSSIYDMDISTNNIRRIKILKLLGNELDERSESICHFFNHYGKYITFLDIQAGG